jgi:hypothetical protein
MELVCPATSGNDTISIKFTDIYCRVLALLPKVLAPSFWVHSTLWQISLAS